MVERMPGIAEKLEGAERVGGIQGVGSMGVRSRRVSGDGYLLIGDADITQVTGGYGFIGDFKAGRKGIVLKPDAYDGDSVFKVPFPKVKRGDFPEGRGIFVQQGRAVTVQLPLVPEGAALAPQAQPEPAGMGSPPH